MKILVTGAHFTPAVAVIEELKKNNEVNVVYVGRKTAQEGDKTSSAESEILPKLGVKFISIITGRLQRTFTVYTIPSLLKIPIGLFQALYIILSERPEVILSFGGYVAVPVVITGWLFSIPIIIHEQTLVPGLANKISAFFADKIALAFSQNKSFDEQKTIITGNPLRHEVLQIQGGGENRRSGKPIILIAGGNQGSHVINSAVEEILPKLTKIVSVVHQTGDSKFGDFERLKQKENEFYKVEKFISNGWGEILNKCDLVISRAGINTLTELAYFQKPALVIPIRNHHEQNTNAKYFANLNLIKILPQSQLTGETLLENIKLMLKDIKSLKEKAKIAKGIIIPDAAKRLSLETILLGQRIEL